VQYNKPMTASAPTSPRLFMEHEWPGNVRQLENMIKRMVVLGGEAPILAELQQPAALFPIRAHRRRRLLPVCPFRSRSLIPPVTRSRMRRVPRWESLPGIPRRPARRPGPTLFP
jgi:DNA-binding NtrC family response regulator